MHGLSAVTRWKAQSTYRTQVEKPHFAGSQSLAPGDAIWFQTRLTRPSGGAGFSPRVSGSIRSGRVTRRLSF
jgi:hypothetical protein